MSKYKNNIQLAKHSIIREVGTEGNYLRTPPVIQRTRRLGGKKVSIEELQQAHYELRRDEVITITPRGKTKIKSN